MAYTTIDEMVAGCKVGDPLAQKALYKEMSPLLYGVARRYVRDVQHAEDAFIRGMHKILTRLDDFSGKGSLEGWMRRIVVNECLMHLRKPVQQAHYIEPEPQHAALSASALDNLQVQDLLALLDELPDGYRTVFNLYVLEGYKHGEIAEMLGVSESTSKSQLHLAKKKLRKLITTRYPGYASNE